MRKRSQVRSWSISRLTLVLVWQQDEASWLEWRTVQMKRMQEKEEDEGSTSSSSSVTISKDHWD